MTKPARHLTLRTMLLLTGVLACTSAPAADSARATHVATPPTLAGASPPPRTALLGNLGSYHRAITTQSADAQRFFDEGLTLLYGFNHAEAFRSFARAAALDSAAPMPHWGMALALGTNINDIAPVDRLKLAHGYLAGAVARRASSSAVEQGLIDALSQRYIADPTGDQMLREQAYSDAMRALYKQFADDPDVATLFAESLMNLRPWKLYKADGTPAPETATIVATLENVLRSQPEHPGANHYFVHAVEASSHPERAIIPARRLETLVPGAGHLVHMPAHIYIRTGDYSRAALANVTAAAVDDTYFKATGTSGLYSDIYYSHNLQFEAAAAMFSGNLSEARDAAHRTVLLTGPIADQMAMLEPFAAMECFVAVRFERWADVLLLPAPPAKRILQIVLYQWARGAAFAATGNAPDAAAALQAITTALPLIPADAMVGPSNTARAVAAVAKADLAGRVALGRGELNIAIAAFSDAVAAEDKLGYNEPPDWLLPEREMLGRALLQASRAARAESVFRADLTRNTGNPRSLFGVWQSLKAQHKPFDPARLLFDAAWSASDIGSPWAVDSTVKK